jgi:hypothetical protein
LRRPKRGDTFRPRDPPRPYECHEIASRLALVAALVLSFALAAAPARAGAPPSPGAAEIGDRLFPGLGNGGYDALHYGDEWRAQYGPVARPATAETLFSPNVYHGGALVLYALREVIGQRAFARLERAWTQRYRGKSASTEDFIELASRVARRDLTAFLEEWLYGATTPPMPNHPDWTVNLVEEPAPAASAFASGGRRDARR